MTFEEWLSKEFGLSKTTIAFRLESNDFDTLARQTAWNAAIEEAAQACEAKANQRENRFDWDGQEAAADCAEAVLTLKS